MTSNSDVSLVLTAIGDDRPGLVEQLATAVSQHQGNWLQSSMAHLAGKFAGIVCVSVPAPQLEKLMAVLAALPGLRVTAEHSLPSGSQSGGRRLKLVLVGHDRIGIVREVSQVLARHAVNVEDLSTHTASAPMSADVLFHATAELTASPTLDASALTRDLEQLSNDLMVDITLDETAAT
jgi:glycine cleavage system regulatory protein